MARLLIAGCGYVGRALAAQLAARGHRVFGLRRGAGGLPPGVTPVRADLGDPRGLRAALEAVARPGSETRGSAAGVALDAAVVTVAPHRSTEADYRATYATGLRHLLGALEASGNLPRHLLVASSTSVYAQSDGGWVDETSPTEPRHWSGRIQLEAEATARASGIATTVVRLGGIYGPGRTHLLESVRTGRVWEGRALDRYTNRIHRDDAAGVFAELVTRLVGGEALPDLLLGVDDEPARLGTVALWLARRLGVPHPADERAALAAAGSPATPPSARAATNKRCANRRLRGLGIGLRYPTFREGYAALLPGRGEARGPLSEP